MSLSSFIAKLAGATALVGLSAFGVQAQTSGEAIKIGAIVSVTGAGAGLGVPERNGLLLAEKDINAKGGIKGRPIKIIVEDDASNPDTALSKANDLIFGQKVQALLGPSLTASTVAVGGVTHANKIPQIAFTGIGPAVERDRKCVAHVLPPQRLNATALLEYAKSIKATKIGVLHDAGYGNVVMAELKPLADKYGVKLVAVEKFEIGATDTTTQAAKVKAESPKKAAPALQHRHLRHAVPQRQADPDHPTGNRRDRFLVLRVRQRHGTGRGQHRDSRIRGR